MNIKDKVEALLDYANDTTGETDTDLTSGIASLIEGYGGGGSVVAGEVTISADIVSSTGGKIMDISEIGFVPSAFFLWHEGDEVAYAYSYLSCYMPATDSKVFKFTVYRASNAKTIEPLSYYGEGGTLGTKINDTELWYYGSSDAKLGAGTYKWVAIP